MDMMIYYRDNPKRAIYFSLFVMTILQLNDIECNEEDLTKSPKILDYGILEKMRYYKDSNGDYYYLEDSGRKIYDDKIHEKEVTETTDPSIASASVDASTFVDMNALLDDVTLKVLADNHIRKDQIMAAIKAFSNVGEKNRVKIKEEI